MNLRTKLILSICVFMLLVCALLTLNIAIDAATRAKAEERQRAEFLQALLTDWAGSAADAGKAPDWRAVEARLAASSLVEGWLVVSREPDGSLSVATSRPVTRLPGPDEPRLREALDSGRIVVDRRRAYVPLPAAGSACAARLDLRSRYGGGIPAAGGLGGLILVMAIGTALLVLNAYIFLNRFVLRPLDALVEASRHIAEGDFTRKIPERPTYDEMAALVNAFNLMIDKIAKHQASLIDDVRRARERITSTEKRLFAAQRLSTTGTLAAGIAHEINNPLGGMVNAARTIRAGGMTPEKQQEYLELIIDGLERIRTIVQKVLQFRPKALEPQPVALRDVVARAVSFMDHRARQKGVQIRNELPEDLPPVHADPLELQQAFLNVVMNAVDACVLNEGAVTVTPRTEDGWVTAVVADNGCGMDEEELARCTDLFFTTKDVGEGTGLGLSVAQNIVQNHGGKLEIRSERGKGTTVSIRLPVRREATRRLPAAEKTP